jgi:hypothetical protein
MAQQTAVEWFIEQLIPKDQHEGIMDIIEQAKQMEKEQIINAWIATDNELQRIAAEKYYNEIYNK